MKKTIVILTINIILVVVFLSILINLPNKNKIYRQNTVKTTQILDELSEDTIKIFTPEQSKYKLLSLTLGGFGNLLYFEDKSQYELIVFSNKLRTYVYKCMEPDYYMYDSIAWGNTPFKDTLIHGSYLPWFNLLLSSYTYIINKVSKKYNYSYDPPIKIDTFLVNLNTSITNKFLKGYYLNKAKMLEVYPSKIITTDNSVALASMALYYKATKTQYPDSFNYVVNNFLKLSVDSVSGLMYSYIDYKTGESDDVVLGSGTTVSTYFLYYVDTIIAKNLYENTIKNQLKTIFTVSGIKEYYNTPDIPYFYGDSDTGPIIFEIGTVATGFTLANSRLYRDKDIYNKLWNVTSNIGIPTHCSITDNFRFRAVPNYYTAIMTPLLNGKYLGFLNN